MYDFVVCFRTGGLTPALVAHHSLGLSLWVALLALDCGGVFALWVQLAEGSTPLLHATTSLRKLGLGSSALCKATGLCTVLTFFLLRVLLQPLCLVEVWHSSPLWTGRAGLRAAFWAMTASGVFFVCLNMYWFALMLRAVAHTIRADEPAARRQGAHADASLAAAPAEGEERKRR